MVIPKRQCSDIWSIFAPLRMRMSGKGNNWCFCLVAIVWDLVLIGLMTIWLLSHQLDTWSKLSCILLLICRISFPEVCSVVSSASMSQSAHIFFMCNGRSLIKRLKRIGPKIIYTLIWFVMVLFCPVVPVHAHAMLPSCYYTLWAFGSILFWLFS